MEAMELMMDLERQLPSAQHMHYARRDPYLIPFDVKSSPRLWDGAYSSQEKFTQLDVASRSSSTPCRSFLWQSGAISNSTNPL